MVPSTSLPMPNVVHGLSSFPFSPAGSNFVPRKEFAPEPVHQASSFALLAFSANNVIRLSNFPPALVKDLRERLDSIIGIHSFRENTEQKLCEIVLTGKPWSNTKAMSTEILVVQVFATVLAYGYSLLSHLHYGKEHNDRITFAFSISGVVDNLGPLVPFALSFTSSTSLRVVCSPLHATPAILQSVRNAWPRGVTSERKLGEHCYEFKLKGYSWFQEDHFAQDALTFMLALLTSLDKHRWTFTTSVSLSSNHSRNRDLWIFSGPGSFTPNLAGTRPLTPINLGSPLKPSVHEAIFDERKENSEESQPSEIKHFRSATESQAMLRRSRTPSEDDTKVGHFRSASDVAGCMGSEQRLRRSPETITASPVVQVASPKSEIIVEGTSSQGPLNQPPRHSLISLPEEVDRNRDEHDSQSQPYSKDDAETVLVTFNNVEVVTPPITQEVTTSTLLGPTAFRSHSGSEGRNSTFSDATRRSLDITVGWIPDGQQIAQDTRRLSLSEFPQGVINPRQSFATARTETTLGPLPPGAWMNTPLVEREDPVSSQRPSPTPHKETPPQLEPRQSTIVCHPPQLVNPDLPDMPTYRAKSETGEIGMMTSLPDTSAGASSLNDRDLRERVQGGWVLVNLNPSGSVSSVPQPDSSTTTELQASKKTSPTSVGVLAEPSSSPLPPAQASEATRQREDIPRVDSPKKASKPQRPEKSKMGRFLSRRMVSQKAKRIHENALSDREKDQRLKETGSVLPAIPSNKRLNID